MNKMEASRGKVLIELAAEVRKAMPDAIRALRQAASEVEEKAKLLSMRWYERLWYWCKVTVLILWGKQRIGE